MLKIIKANTDIHLTIVRSILREMKTSAVFEILIILILEITN